MTQQLIVACNIPVTSLLVHSELDKSDLGLSCSRISNAPKFCIVAAPWRSGSDPGGLEASGGYCDPFDLLYGSGNR